MIRKFLFSVLAALLFFASVQAQVPDAEGSLVKWMTLKEAMEKNKTQPKPIIIDFYTDWCGWCKTMMKTTYADQDVSAYINGNFYPVKFNAETKDTIEYLGEKYGPVGNGKNATNALALKLLQGKLMYPTTLFLNNFDQQKNEFVFSMLAQGYLDIAKYQPMLIFALENAFKNSNYQDFKDQYDKAFFDTATDGKLKKLKWLTPVEAFDKKTTSKKKLLILVHTNWCNACKVMARTSFTNDTSTIKYLNEKYDLVDFDPQITDTILFKGQSFVNPMSRQSQFHQLSVALCRNSLILPTLVVMDEELNLVDAIPFYINPPLLKNIATFYGDEINKKKSWGDYIAGINKQLPEKK